jgi:PAS domain S-box-containing protein
VALRFIEETGVLNALGFGIVVSDARGTVMFANATAVSLYAPDGQGLAGADLHDLLSGDASDPDVRQRVDQALSGAPWTGEVVDTGTDGSPRLIRLGMTPIHEGEVVTGIVVLCEELTSARRAEAIAAANERRMRLAYEAAELGSWQWDMSTGLVVWDERLEAIFGLAPGTYDGTFETWLAMIHPDEHAGVMATLDEAVAARSSYNLNVRIVWPDGSEHWIESLGRVTTNEANEPTGSIGCVWDTTARREVERELAAAFEAQQEASDLAEEMSVEREKLVTRVSEIADHLQTSLAASPIPDVEGATIAVHYAPGGDELEQVGGDWYDAVHTVNGSVALVVGDVMGRGVSAATTMVRVRAGIRGLLTVDPLPHVVLAHADVLLARDAPEQFVTAVAVLIDPGTGDLSICNAGHIPVVLVRPDGSAELVATSGLPLGLPEGLARRAHMEVLEPGTIVLMVTDGVVEGRDYDVDEGIERLRSRAAQLAQEPLDVLVRQIAGLADRSLRDDVTVVAVRLT